MGKQAAPITEQDAFSMDALTLAYMGDVVWSLFIRDTLIHTGIYQVQILSTLTSEIVSARWQSRILFEIREVLNDRELKVCKRGRNTSSTVPKSATVEEYREATAFEALLGYLKHSLCLSCTRRAIEKAGKAASEVGFFQSIFDTLEMLLIQEGS